MKTETIKLTENIYAVVVPKDSIQYKVETLDADEDYEAMTVLIFDNLDYIQLPLGKYELLGEVTADEITFDCEPYVEKNHFVSMFDGKETHNYKNYLYPNYMCLDAKESLYSLLQSKEIYFVNPIEKPNGEDYYYDSQVSFDEVETNYDLESYKSDLAKWQEYESKVVEKVIIIKKV